MHTFPSISSSSIGRATAWALVVATSIAAFLIDYLTHPAFEIYGLYLIPALLATWFIGFNVGCVFLAVGIFSWGCVDLIHRPEMQFWIWAINSTVRSAIWLMVIWSISRIQTMSKALSQLSLCDELTGLPNRRALLSRGELEMQRMKRSKNSLSIMFVDVDNFKKLNDSQGHKAGDALLEEVAEVFNHSIRKTDFVARLGGDEFAVLFPDTDEATAGRLAKKIKNAAKDVLGKSKISLSLSMGVATFNRAQDSFDKALAFADHLMYEVKRQGKDAILQRSV